MTDQPSPLDAPFGLLSDLIRRHALARPDAPALIEGEGRMTYGELDAMADRIAASLQRDGVAQREAVAICAASSIPYMAVYLGALRAGVAVAPLSPSSTPDALAMMVRDCGARLMFLDAASAGLLDAAASPPDAPRIFLEGDGAPALEDWLAPAGSAPAAVSVDPDDPFNIIYSSGTTGAPKGIVQPHMMRWGHIKRARTLGYDETAVTMISTPLYSNTTLVAVFPTLAGGGACVLMRKSDIPAFLRLAERHRATHAMLVPVQYRRFMDEPTFDSFDLSSFRMKASTSAPFPAELKAEVLRRWPGGLIEYYGMTEGGGTCVLMAHKFPDKLHTVGQPGEGHDIRIIDENGVELPRGETGEVVGRSGAMMSAYHNQPAKTSEAEWYSPDGLRFIRTGDVGRFDEDGFLILGDRKKDMIISGGFNIYPSDLEAELARHPDVVESAVVGVPSREWGETPAAFVVARPGADVTPEQLREWVNARVGRMQRIASLQFIDVLPRSSIGKVLKRQLRDSFASGSHSPGE